MYSYIHINPPWNLSNRKTLSESKESTTLEMQAPQSRIP